MIRKYQKIPATLASEVVEAAQFTGWKSYWQMAEAWPGMVSQLTEASGRTGNMIVTTIKNNSIITLRVVESEYVIRHPDGGHEKLSAEEFEAQYKEYPEPDTTLRK